MSLKMFKFWVRNETTGDVVCFLGQGEHLAEAAKDGIDNLGAAHRTRSSGKPGQPVLCWVKTRDGRDVKRTLPKFEGDTPYDAATEATAAPTAVAPDDEEEPAA